MKNYKSHFHLFLFRLARSAWESLLSHGVRAKTKQRLIYLFSVFSFLFFGFFSISVAFAAEYQKIAPGETITLGEFLFEDDFSPSTEDCTITITDPSNNEVVSAVIMNERADGWHYYDYATATNASSGTWRVIMSCGSMGAGNLVKADKSFIVDSLFQNKWTVTLSDFEGTTTNTAYKAKLQVLNDATIPTDADSLPTVVITDSAGTIQVPSGVMTRDSSGTYSFSYSIGGSAVGGVWETEVSVVINGETIERNDYWNLSGSPADVQIIEITDKIVPTITANVRIDNKGTAGSDFLYVYCIVSSEDNLCGGGDDVDSASGTAFINAGGFINVSLTLDDVISPGTYWFKVRVRALAEINWAVATQQFIAESEVTPTPPPPSPGGGGGGGGAAAILPPPPADSCNGADFNNDSKVNSIDFSILLAFWQKLPPFLNPCVDINKDNKVNSIDFSILLYQWGK